MKTVDFEGNTWEVTAEGLPSGGGVGEADKVALTQQLATFRCLTNPALKEEYGFVPSDRDLDNLTNEDLVHCLVRAMGRPIA